MKKSLLFAITLSLSLSGSVFARKFPGLAPTPPMGWNRPWEWAVCALNTGPAMSRPSAAGHTPFGDICFPPHAFAGRTKSSPL